MSSKKRFRADAGKPLEPPSQTRRRQIRANRKNVQRKISTDDLQPHEEGTQSVRGVVKKIRFGLTRRVRFGNWSADLRAKFSLAPPPTRPTRDIETLWLIYLQVVEGATATGTVAAKTAEAVQLPFVCYRSPTKCS